MWNQLMFQKIKLGVNFNLEDFVKKKHFKLCIYRINIMNRKCLKKD